MTCLYGELFQRKINLDKVFVTLVTHSHLQYSALGSHLPVHVILDFIGGDGHALVTAEHAGRGAHVGQNRGVQVVTPQLVGKAVVDVVTHTIRLVEVAVVMRRGQPILDVSGSERRRGGGLASIGFGPGVCVLLRVGTH